nr:hypothetical protein [Tanacetum cinerariifolium]
MEKSDVLKKGDGFNPSVEYDNYENHAARKDAGYVNGAVTGNVNSIAVINYEFTSMMEKLAGSGATDAATRDSNDTIVESELQSTPCTHHDIISEIFGLSLKTFMDFEDFISNIELGKYEVWLELSDIKRQEVSDTLCAMFKDLKDDNIPSKVSPSDPIVQSVNINTMSTSYAGDVSTSAKDLPKVNSTFVPWWLNLFLMAIPNKVVKKVVSPSIVATSNVVTPTVEKTNNDFQTMGKNKKKKGKSKSINGEEDEKENVENVYDETSNLFLTTKTGGSLSFTAADG